MASNRTKKINKIDSSSSSTGIIDSRHRSSEVTHVLLRELSTQKLVIVQISSLSSAARMKPLTSGRSVSFRHGGERGQKQGEILFLAIKHISLTNSPQKRQRQDDPFEQTYNDKCVPAFNSSISSDLAETSFGQSPSRLQPGFSQKYTLPSPSSTLPTLVTTKTATSNSLLSECSTNTIDETSMEDNMVDPASSITTQQSLSLPLPSESSLSVITNTKTSTNSSTSRLVVASTTIRRKGTAGESLKELKRLQSLVKSRDNEISKLTEQIKQLKDEIEKLEKYSIFIPTNDIVIQWVDYLYESIHKEEIQNQVDLDTTAIELGIERESLDLCLELSDTNRISTARQLLKSCINYDEAIRLEHCWQNIDEDIVAKICRFVREFFGVSLKFDDDYVRESLSNMMRKDSWSFRNPDKSKTKTKRSSSTSRKLSSRQSEEIYADGDDDTNFDNDVEHI